MNELTAVVLGATGLTGSLLLQELLKDKDYKTVRILVRRNVNVSHPKLEQEIVDFNDIDDYTKKFGEGDVIFSCIGTTQKNVKGDKALYEKIDLDIPVNAAKIGISKNYKKIINIILESNLPQNQDFWSAALDDYPTQMQEEIVPYYEKKLLEIGLAKSTNNNQRRIKV